MKSHSNCDNKRFVFINTMSYLINLFIFETGTFHKQFGYIRTRYLRKFVLIILHILKTKATEVFSCIYSTLPLLHDNYTLILWKIQFGLVKRNFASFQHLKSHNTFLESQYSIFSQHAWNALHFEFLNSSSHCPLVSFSHTSNIVTLVTPRTFLLYFWASQHFLLLDSSTSSYFP